MNKILMAFAGFPREGHSPSDAAKKHNSKRILNVRGNVYERLSGRLDKSTREHYLSSVAALSDLMEKSNMDISCILKKLKNA